MPALMHFREVVLVQILLPMATSAGEGGKGEEGGEKRERITEGKGK